ncbi:PLP-dependent transferase [Rhodocytophaga rosea]|uniref:PLP-dependent transferase n=1 Tax=Rhodocytophaga rosea TaxID=2704465 RepID=A0A6C0GHS8_9BACT|nr:PLP-dependent aspartate aminotransferase family protein [Rhodocytophaga rosea]QHT67242.1 PLP-dependent transferase [Rhodocytophaga rosea]
MEEKLSKETLCIHAGSELIPHSQSVVTPVYPASSYKYRETTENTYPRYFNTINQKVIVEKLCALEGAQDGILFSSGMAAISTTLFALLQQGDHVVFCKGLYGGTYHLVTSEFEKRGIQFSFAADHSTEAFSAILTPHTKVIYIETPSNPLLEILDIQAISQLAKKKAIITVIDNTFASPINQNPISLGFDVVIHSGTKYLGGHSDLCFGAVVTSSVLKERIYALAVNYGGSINALDCYLIERSLKTLAVRVEKHNENAMILASFLQELPEVKNVYYPGLKSHPGHEIASAQMHGFGGMLSFELATNSLTQVDLFLDKLRFIQPAMSLGGVESLICSPATTSHATLSQQERQEIGISDGLLRFSVGIENSQDLIKDLKSAFRSLSVLAHVR